MHYSTTPHALFDYLIYKYKLKNDAALARCMETLPGVISKMRHRKYPFSEEMVLRVHEYFEVPIQIIRELLVEAKHPISNKKYRSQMGNRVIVRSGEKSAPAVPNDNTIDTP